MMIIIIIMIIKNYRKMNLKRYYYHHHHHHHFHNIITIIIIIIINFIIIIIIIIKQRREDVLAIVDSLTLRCPNTYCSVALDPSPDGCCAMRCVTCGKHFCWLCFQIQTDNGNNHNHVRNCGENPKPGNLFPRKDLVEIVHKQRRIEAVRKCLMKLTNEIGIVISIVVIIIMITIIIINIIINRIKEKK